ncbi:hypothetical protein KWA75_004223 [Salmonella enterica]|nr:hypothetical protein [Salmonella enterica subsp. enterica serovar Teddington]ECE1929286.1 hypothetical protein [Salmonella enterica]EHS6172713.1 hypothetical protein [Salmonella enterica]
MNERGMIFNGEMVRAILDGRKTQTRRPIKWKQTRFTEIGEREDGSNWPWSEDTEKACDYWHPCPFGAVGDRIWVRETFGWQIRRDPVGGTGEFRVYRATTPDAVRYQTASGEAAPMKWVPSIHMPRRASRILLEITDVRVERLNNISECDAKAEGGPTECTLIGDKYFPGFRSLWKSIYGEESWAANPWVWAITFRRVE